LVVAKRRRAVLHRSAAVFDVSIEKLSAIVSDCRLLPMLAWLHVAFLLNAGSPHLGFRRAALHQLHHRKRDCPAIDGFFQKRVAQVRNQIDSRIGFPQNNLACQVFHVQIGLRVGIACMQL
jgi:hypothetical protein